MKLLKSLLLRFTWIDLYFILLLPILLGSVYLPTRLYFIGETRKDKIIAIEQKTIDYFGGLTYSFTYYYSITLQNHPVPLEAPYYRDYRIGQEVTLLYSDRLHLVMIVPENYGYFHVVYNFWPKNNSQRAITVTILFIVLAILIPLRGQRLALHILKRIQNAWRETIKNERNTLEKAIGFTDFLSKVTTVFIAITCALVVVFLIISTVLLVEQTSFLLTSITLFVSSSIIFSPVLENIIDFIINIKNNDDLNRLVVILRNLVATVAGGVLIYKLIEFMYYEDFQRFDRIIDIFQELVSFLFS